MGFELELEDFGDYAKFIGFAFLVERFYRFLSFFWVYFLRPSVDLKRLGSWAVVTGATDGIGKAMAKQLAKQGMNVVLISRTESKLVNVQKELEEATGKEFKTIAIDFGKFDEGSQQRMMNVCKDLDVGVLVNNVGMSYSFPGVLTDIESSKLETMISINCQATTVMTRLLLPGMLTRKKGTVVNVASVAGIAPMPMLNVYGATKMFVKSFTENLQHEYSHTPLTFSCHMPFFVVSKMSKIRRPSLTTPLPDAYARSACSYIGHNACLHPYWSHAIQGAILNKLPRSLQAWGINKLHKDIRRRALRKLAKKR